MQPYIYERNNDTYTKMFDIDVMFLLEVANNNKRLSLLKSSIVRTYSVKSGAESFH